MTSGILTIPVVDRAFNVLFSPIEQGSSPSRVVITGAGIVTGLGRGWGANAAGFQAGTVAIKPVTLFDVSRQRVKVAAEASLSVSALNGRIPRRHLGRMDRASFLLLLAAEEAWKQAEWEAGENLPVVLGTTSGGMSLGETYYRQAIHTPHRQRKQAIRVVHYQAQRQGLDLADAFGFNGPLTIIANACASGANAIGHAFDLVRANQSSRVLTGGYDALSQLVFAGFDSLQALSPTTCRPFDANRDGLALGEGAAIFCLENLEHAQKRGAEILGEICGYGAATDAHHLTQPHPEGVAAFASMSAACESAGVKASQIGYVNAHGTGTPLNDSSEAAAINRWAGDHARLLPVSSIKSSIGHLLGAAGAVETMTCLMALRGQWLPPTPTTRTPDPTCKFPLVTVPTDASFEYALTNSFGFGGANASIILRRWS
jgi:3-oxoacyl-[acyl-carrier-protein] synthase II